MLAYLEILKRQFSPRLPSWLSVCSVRFRGGFFFYVCLISCFSFYCFKFKCPAECLRSSFPFPTCVPIVLRRNKSYPTTKHSDWLEGGGEGPTTVSSNFASVAFALLNLRRFSSPNGYAFSCRKRKTIEESGHFGGRGPLISVHNLPEFLLHTHPCHIPQSPRPGQTNLTGPAVKCHHPVQNYHGQL